MADISPIPVVREAWYPAENTHTAEVTMSRWQQIAFFAVIGIVILQAILQLTFVVVVIAVLIWIYLLQSGFRILLAWHSLHSAVIAVSQEQLDSLTDEELPVYTVLIPLFREGRQVLGRLFNHLDALDYPRDKLDVILLVEENDDGPDDGEKKAEDRYTLAALRSMPVPLHYRIQSIPQKGPQTKPKACNIGLENARGEFVVIYDAEDRPEPSQLKKVVYAFNNLVADDIACLQAKLEYSNHDTNILTRLFCNEYATFFGLVLPGLGKLKLPVPLGGTSNHFRREVLERFTWDPWCVAEDANLGMWLARRGHQVEIIDSTTWEVATSKLHGGPGQGGWIKQRSRWTKGYMQTYLVHMRDPRQLYRDLGFKKFLGFQLIVGTPILTNLVNPLFWGLTIAYAVTRSPLIEALFPTKVLYLGVICMFANLVFIYISMIGSMSRGTPVNIPAALLEPCYWGLQSYATWKGALELPTKPHHWHKTDHELTPKQGRKELLRVVK